MYRKSTRSDLVQRVRLGPESRKRLAFSTHTGVLLQNVLPFGISSAPGYFQKIMDDLTFDLPGVAVYLDDISVIGVTSVPTLEIVTAVNDTKVTVELNTATAANFLSLQEWQRLEKPQLCKTLCKFQTASKRELPVRGSFEATSSYRNCATSLIFGYGFESTGK